MDPLKYHIMKLIIFYFNYLSTHTHWVPSFWGAMCDFDILSWGWEVFPDPKGASRRHIFCVTGGWWKFEEKRGWMMLWIYLVYIYIISQTLHVWYTLPKKSTECSERFGSLRTTFSSGMMFVRGFLFFFLEVYVESWTLPKYKSDAFCFLPTSRLDFATCSLVARFGCTHRHTRFQRWFTCKFKLGEEEIHVTDGSFSMGWNHGSIVYSHE